MLLTFFPNIPEGACFEILEHGFEKGSGRVGRSKTLENKLKVQLAVNAHIRHRLTQYDSILASNKGQDAKLAARDMVYDQVKAIAESWRGGEFRLPNSKSPTRLTRDSAATFEANRQRRNRASNARKVTGLEEALRGMGLNESEREAAARTDAAQRRTQKKAQKAARRARARDKKKKEEATLSKKARKARHRKGKYLPTTSR